MWWSQNSGSNADVNAGINRRQHARYPTGQSLSCPLGELADMSATGLRITCKGKPPVSIGEFIPLTVRGNGQKLTINARIVRLERTGLRSFNIGMAFIEPDPAVVKALESLARFGFVGARSSTRPRPTRSRQKQPTVIANLANHYQTLKVQPTAPTETIRQAYRLLARQYHPDVCQQDDAERRFQQIHEAYAVLNDPQRRKTYDTLMIKQAG